MLFKKDENKLIKELREEIDELIYGKEVNNLINYQLERRVEELQKEVKFLKLREAGFEERLKEQLESYEEKLIQRDLKISSMELLHEQLEEQIESLEEENSHLRKELEEAVAELNGCNPSKSSYPTVTINVDVRDVLAKQLAKSLKQANEAFEKRYKKKYEYTKAGTSKYYKCTTLDELLNELNSTYWIKEADLNSLREAYESLEEIFNEKGKAYATLSFYSIEYGSHIYIMAGIIKEEI